jgi:NADPH-dependent 2,4-dienoyl-CoA reductase/sulfur reductase-like enzyme
LNAPQLLVIGGVAAGMSAASRARRLDPDLEITVLEKGPHVSYSACGLPWFVGGKIQASDLLVHSADFFREKRGLDVRIGVEAHEIELGRHRVRAVGTETGQEQIFHFDRLVIATGARVAWPAIPGLLLTPGAKPLPHVFPANTLLAASALDERLRASGARQAVVLGGGYIGLETAEALRDRGLDVTIVQKTDRILRPFDDEIVLRVEQALAARGIALRKGAPALAVNENEVISEAGRHPAQLVVVATGLRPNVELAESAGIALGPTGAIAVDDGMRTNEPSIFAAGDCAETTHLVTRRPVWIPLGTTANKQGRVAGENASGLAGSNSGGRARFPGVVGTMVTQICGLECARTGLSQREAQAASFRAVSVDIEHSTHARYLGAGKLYVKLIGERGSGRLLGAQMAGPTAGKRIDVIATALHARMTVDQLSQLDLSYHPAVAPVWEAVLVAAHELGKQL